MKRIPARPDPDHLRKQAKQLLADYRRGHSEALDRFRTHLPAARGATDKTLAALDLRLHDAQSCLAREHGLARWTDLMGFVEARLAQAADPTEARRQWYRLVYAGDVTGGMQSPQPAVAARLLESSGPSADGHDDDPWLACATGDLARLARAVADDPGWLHRAGGPLALPPLVAVTHSSLLRLPGFRDRLRACAQWLLDAGADPDAGIGSRWPPDSLQAPSDQHRLSALYGAAGRNRDAQLTQRLLQAGANPNDGESLYHALESPACTQRLLEAGARIAGTHALYRVLDLDRLDVLNALLAHGADPNEAPPGESAATAWGHPLLWAIRRRRSAAHIEALLKAGADPAVRTADGTDAATLALNFGLPEIARRLEQAGIHPQDTPVQRFLAACARGDEAAARQWQERHPELPHSLSPPHLRLLPELAAQGCREAVACMARLGWPIAVAGGDWSASALNQAVFRGDAAMTRLLLEHGASWTERHAYDDDCSGTLSWASCNVANDRPDDSAGPDDTDAADVFERPDVHGGGDWLGCAQALVDHGMPGAQPDPQDAQTVLHQGRRMRFAEDVADFLLAAGARGH